MEFTIDSSKIYCSYFKAYMIVHGLKTGDKVKSHEYIGWITQKHNEFKGKIGLNSYVPYSDEQGKDFIKFIKGDYDV